MLFLFVTLNFPILAGHADVLRRVYTKVSEKLDAQSVARNMFQCNALTLKELESIQSKHSEPVKAAERLLTIVMNQSGSVYEFFMNALKLTGQKHVCEIIVTGTDEGKTFVYNRVNCNISKQCMFICQTTELRYVNDLIVGCESQTINITNAPRDGCNQNVVNIILTRNASFE